MHELQTLLTNFYSRWLYKLVRGNLFRDQVFINLFFNCTSTTGSWRKIFTTNLAKIAVTNKVCDSISFNFNGITTLNLLFYFLYVYIRRQVTYHMMHTWHMSLTTLLIRLRVCVYILDPAFGGIYISAICMVIGIP